MDLYSSYHLRKTSNVLTTVVTTGTLINK